MNYSKINKLDAGNGQGIRVSLFVSGCNFRCKGCFNANIQDFKAGKPFTKIEEDLIINLAKNKYIEGLSVLGGEPLSQDDTLINFLIRFKKEVGKSVFLWTGFRVQQLNKKQLEVLKYVDVVIDGPFVEALYEPNLKWRGSSNQKIYKPLEDGRLWNVTYYYNDCKYL